MDETIGQQLRQAREARSLTLEQVAHSTHMRARYLQALEKDNYDSIPSAAQARGFLRSYASFLNLDPEELLQSLNGGPVSPTPSPPSEPPTQPPLAQPPPAPAGEVEAIFAEVGRSLQHQRELLGLSLEDVVRHTHLRQHYLVALENGDLKNLPSPVQGRGMLKNYASFLGLDPEPLLLRFAEGLQAGLAVKRAARAAEKPEAPRPVPLLPAPVRRFLSGDLLIGGLLALSMVAFVIWGAIHIYSLHSGKTPPATAPSIADILLATETSTPTLTPHPGSPTAPSLPAAAAPTQEETNASATVQFTPPPVGEEAVQVYVTVHQRAWMRVQVDGKVEFEGRVIPGNAYSFAGKSQVEILTGNGSALQIFFNQEDLGLMGIFGQVVDRVYSTEGVLQPTATVTPTPTATLRASPTPRPSATPRPGTPTTPALP